MNAYILKQLSIVKFSASLATCGLALGMVAPAQAANFGYGDFLTVAANQIVTGNLRGDVSQLHFDFLSEPQNSSSGLIVVQTGSLGFFETYETGKAGNCEQTNSNCTIKDTTLTGSIADFLKYDDGTGGLDDWTLSISNISVSADVISRVGSQQRRQISFISDGVFKNLTTGQTIAAISPVNFEVGFFLTGPNRSQGNFQLIAEPVPEPLTILAVGTAIAFGVNFKRKLAAQK